MLHSRMIDLRTYRTVAESEDRLAWSIMMLAVSLLIYIGGSKLRLGGRRKRYDYSRLPHFSKYDVENGYLLDVREGDSRIEFTVETPLTYAHPVYEYQRTLRTKILDV